MPGFSKCLSIINSIHQKDQDRLVELLDEHLAAGVKPELAQRMAARGVLNEIKYEGLAKHSDRLQTDTPEFKAWSYDAPLVKLGEKYQFKSGQPVVVEALHGTTHDITQFDKSKAQIESDFGAGFYASSAPSDVASNYASEAGPDLTNRIERTAEQIINDDEFEGSQEDAHAIAKQRISGGAPNTMKVFMRFKNPAVLGGKDETFFDYSEEYNEETDGYEEPEGLLVDFILSLDDIGSGLDISMRDVESTKSKLFEAAEGEGVRFKDLIDIVKEGMMETMGVENGDSGTSEALRQALEGMGFDGIIDTTVSKKFKNMGIPVGTNHYIAFEPTQIKSATGNNGQFDSKNQDIRKSIRNGTSNWDMYEESKFDDLVYKMQDKQIDTKRVIESITKYVGKVANDLNVYLQEELFHGRVAKRTHDFAEEELKPLMEDIRKNGYQLRDVEEYLHARHAKEANAVIASRNPGDPNMQDGGSGMTDQAADDYFNNLSATDAQRLAGIAVKVDDIIKKTRNLYATYGLESQATVNGWTSMFQHYIPLHREEKEGSMGIGQGFSVKGKETRGRTGSKRKVVDILANIAMQRERLIVRGEKNRVSVALLGLATANPNPDFWSVGPPPTERVYDPKTNTVVDRADPLYKSRENVLVAKVSDASGNINEMAVRFNEDDPRALRMARALKNLDAAQLEGLLGVSAKITRYFSAINTQYNPVFGVVNLMRDVQSAMLNIGTTPLSNKKAKIGKDTVSALAGIYQDMRAVRNGHPATSQWSQLWEEFQDFGGQTGYRQMFATSADRAAELEATLNPDAWMNSPLGKVFTANGKLKVPVSKAKEGAGFFFDWLSDYNESMENGVRLAAYKAGLDQGMSKEEAASLAKNLTVNFNRKGQVALQAGAMYAFFNAAMQGTARIGQTLFTMEGGNYKSLKLSALGKKIVYGGMMVGVMQAMAMAAMGFGDDDPPEFVKSRSLIIPTGGKTYVSIPMPQGFNVIPGLGRHLTEFALSGFKKPSARVMTILSLFADSFNPIGNAGMSLQTIAPTALDPLAALAENKDFTGRPIARTSSNKATPGFTLHKDTSTYMAKLLAEAINGITGGNAYVAGALSPTPDQIDYLMQQVTGGVGREYSKLEQTVTSAFNGEDVPVYKVPLVGRLIGDAASQASQGSSFYGNVDRLNEIETEVKGLKADHKNADAMAVLRSHPESLLIAQANTAQRQVQKLRKEKSALVERGASREEVKAKEAQITAVMMRLNTAVERLRARS